MSAQTAMTCRLCFHPSEHHSHEWGCGNVGCPCKWIGISGFALTRKVKRVIQEPKEGTR